MEVCEYEIPAAELAELDRLWSELMRKRHARDVADRQERSALEAYRVKVDAVHNAAMARGESHE